MMLITRLLLLLLPTIMNYFFFVYSFENLSLSLFLSQISIINPRKPNPETVGDVNAVYYYDDDNTVESPNFPNSATTYTHIYILREICMCMCDDDEVEIIEIEKLKGIYICMHLSVQSTCIHPSIYLYITPCVNFTKS